MLKDFLLCLLLSVLGTSLLQAQKTQILLLGSDHLSQVFEEEYPNTDVLMPHNQQEMEAFSSVVAEFSPDVVMVEVLPEMQKEIDSLYTLYLGDQLDFSDLEFGRSEVYQLGFRIGKKLGLKKITAVNSEGGTSQGILDNGKNIEVYENETKNLRKVVKETYQSLQQGKLSFQEFLIFLNQPKTYNLIYRLRYITPARVRDGNFTNPDKMVHTDFINPEYIGAELISVFKNRDYKIYSNIVTTKLQEKSKRMLLIIGVGHIGSLKSIIQDDPEFEIVHANEVFKEQRVQGYN